MVGSPGVGLGPLEAVEMRMTVQEQWEGLATEPAEFAASAGLPAAVGLHSRSSARLAATEGGMPARLAPAGAALCTLDTRLRTLLAAAAGRGARKQQEIPVAAAVAAAAAVGTCEHTLLGLSVADTGSMLPTVPGSRPAH